ncbi:hypothetical protein Droror1_Dr00026195 [Drosera rotundifolia]
MERNVNAALQKKLDELQRDLLQVTNEKVKALIELANLKKDYELLKEKINRGSIQEKLQPVEVRTTVGVRGDVFNTFFSEACSWIWNLLLRNQRWDDVHLNQSIYELREAKKRGRNERRHEAEIVIPPAAATVASSSKLSSLRSVPGKLQQNAYCDMQSAEERAKVVQGIISELESQGALPSSNSRWRCLVVVLGSRRRRLLPLWLKWRRDLVVAPCLILSIFGPRR